MGRMIVIAGLLIGCAGCPQYRDANVPNPITQQLAPETASEYFLYVPSNYTHEAKWPLVVLCHGTRPWDTAQRQMLDWVKLAEERSFIVVAPELRGTSAVPMPAAEKQIARQFEDERRILGIVRHLRGAYNISEDRVFLTGWSAGNFAVMFTGLRNPQVFRAIAIQQGNFDLAYVEGLRERIDPHQPVCVLYGSMDLLTGRDGRKCLRWLEEGNVNLHHRELSGGHRGHPEPTQEFFEQVLQREPWLHIRYFSLEGGGGLTVRFKTKGSFTPEQYLWEFGDDEDSPVAEPIHTYAAAGAYTVRLTARGANRRSIRREINLKVPHLDTSFAKPTSWGER